MEQEPDRWQIALDERACIASGVCAATAPHRFRLGRDHSEVLASLVAPDDAVRDAADGCPVEAITIRDVTTGAVIAPSD
jgi:ferredoxin